jgi:hypothetical protein
LYFTDGKLSETGKHHFVYEPSSKTKFLTVEFSAKNPKSKSLFTDAEKESIPAGKTSGKAVQPLILKEVLIKERMNWNAGLFCLNI